MQIMSEVMAISSVAQIIIIFMDMATSSSNHQETRPMDLEISFLVPMETTISEMQTDTFKVTGTLMPETEISSEAQAETTIMVTVTNISDPTAMRMLVVMEITSSMLMETLTMDLETHMPILLEIQYPGMEMSLLMVADFYLLLLFTNLSLIDPS